MSRSPYDDPRRTAYLDLLCNTLAPNHLAGQVGELLAGLNGRLGGRRYVKVLRLVREKRRGELPELVWVRLKDLKQEESVPTLDIQRLELTVTHRESSFVGEGRTSMPRLGMWTENSLHFALILPTLAEERDDDVVDGDSGLRAGKGSACQLAS